MDCPFCTDGEQLPVLKGEIVEHLIVTMNSKRHFHVHGPINDKEMIREFILKIAKESKIEIEDEQ